MIWLVFQCAALIVYKTIELRTFRILYVGWSWKFDNHKKVLKYGFSLSQLYTQYFFAKYFSAIIHPLLKLLPNVTNTLKFTCKILPLNHHIWELFWNSSIKALGSWGLNHLFIINVKLWDSFWGKRIE